MREQPNLDAERWQRAAGIFEQAMDLAAPEREVLVRRLAAGDDALVETVMGMLAADDADNALIDEGVDSIAHLVLDDAGESVPAPGDRLGDFEIMSEIGRGGMGIVYAARDIRLGRVAALKFLPVIDRVDRSASDRLLEEAQAASALDHPNVATIYQVGEAATGRRFIAMARYEGETLRDRLQRGALTPRAAFDIAKQVASGLAAAHAAGLVHRDVKPENIFLTHTGLVKLLDFGIATLPGAAREGQSTRGTVLYMSPEQAKGNGAGASSDVWSLGVVLYEMIVGKTPFDAMSRAEVLKRIRSTDPITFPVEIRKLPAVAADVVQRALARDPAGRFAEAGDFLAALTRAEKSWSRSLWLKVAAVVVAVIALSTWYVSGKRVSPSTQPLMLAVMPVTGDTTNHEATSLASALADEIAARVVGLSRMRLLHVGEAGALNYSTRGLHLLRIAISRADTFPTIKLSLEEAATRNVRWTAQRTLDREELPEISRDLVIGTLDAIGRPASERERAAIGSSFPANPDAYEAYLRGNQLLAIRTPASVESAMVSYRRAASLDSTFAAAYARQSYAYTVLVDWGWKPTARFPGDPLNEALKLADRATSIDSTSADAWLARAYVLVQKDPARFSGSIEAFQHAIALDPYNAEAFHQYGQTLMALGRYTEALAAYRRVMDLEPDRAMTLVPMAAITKRMGHKLQALAYLDSAAAAYPQQPYVRATRALLRAQLGDLKGARSDALAGIAVNSRYRVPQLGVMSRVLWLSGDTAGALARLREAEAAIPDSASPSPTDVFWISVGEVTTGRTDRARKYLRSVKPRGAVAWFMMQAEEFASYNKDPEVNALLAQMDPRK